jgi:hypothetical protein
MVTGAGCVIEVEHYSKLYGDFRAVQISRSGGAG